MVNYRHNYLIVFTIAAIIVAVITTGCTSNAAPTGASAAPVVTGTEKQYITLKTVSSKGSIGLIDIADAKGFFAEQGIKIEDAGTVNGGTEAVQALVADKIDVAGSAWGPWINAINHGSNLKVVAASQGQNEKEPGILWLVHDNSNIRSAQDLAGKKIAVNVLGAEADLVTKAYLAKHNVSVDKVQIVVVPWPQHPQVFVSDQVDVAAANPPYSNMILESGKGRVLFSNYDERGTTALYVYGVREDLVKKNPQAVKGFVTGMAKAADWSTQNPVEAQALVKEIYIKKGSNPDLAKYWTPTQARPHALIEDSDVQWWLNVFVQQGTLKEGQYKPSDIYTNQFNPNSP
jgi:ABC-type nitrate/sulfonate/bicarbonate transport system substrate-binding protein